MSTPNPNENIYSVAKKSTMVEAILTCNWILGFEFYGMSHKKRGFVTFGIGYRIYCVVVQVLFLIGSVALLSHLTSSEVRFLGLVFLHGACCPGPWPRRA